MLVLLTTLGIYLNCVSIPDVLSCNIASWEVRSWKMVIINGLVVHIATKFLSKRDNEKVKSWLVVKACFF